MSVACDILNKIDKIPLLSTSVLQLMEIVGNPDHTLNEIVKIVECDSMLTGHVLKRINSAKYGLVEPITSIARAITYLGDKIVVSMAIAVCAPQVFDQPLKGYDCDKNAMWEHSLKTALAAREIALFVDSKVSPDLAYTTGLMHDIGKPVISEFLVNSSAHIINKIENEEYENYLRGEIEMIGAGHCEVGKELAVKWNLPTVFLPAIEFHHDPDKSEEADRLLVYIIHLADIFAMMCGGSTGADSFKYQINDNYSQHIRMDETDKSSIMLNVLDEYDKTNKLIQEL